MTPPEFEPLSYGGPFLKMPSAHPPFPSRSNVLLPNSSFSESTLSFGSCTLALVRQCDSTLVRSSCSASHSRALPSDSSLRVSRQVPNSITYEPPPLPAFPPPPSSLSARQLSNSRTPNLMYTIEAEHQSCGSKRVSASVDFESPARIFVHRSVSTIFRPTLIA